jgi:predicted acetyltransferase
VLKEASRPVDTPFGKGTFVTVHTDGAGTDDGYVLYEVDWNDGFATNPVGAGQVHDLWGASPEVELALWRYLLDIDLVASWQADVRPVDEPVRRAMHDARAYETRQVLDDQWVRLLDVEAALRARTFGPSRETVTIEVRDPMFAGNCGVWRIAADGAARVDTAPDVTVDIATVSAAYLGAVSWRDLATIGAFSAESDTLDRLDVLFTTRPSPFCGTGY